jgi:cytochrome b pre-mRNA-processing protein 3
MDRTLREMGIGDLSVPKKMRAVGEAFYGRANAYEPCLAAGDAEGLAAAFGRNILSEKPDARNAGHLAAYALAVVASLARISDAEIMAARLAFPGLETFGSSP